MFHLKTRKQNKEIEKHIGNHRYAFSVVLTVYNLEKYVKEAVNSIIGQTFDFNKFIQIIIVDDGSTDGSEAICRSYADKYPKNIKYVKQENGGVSNARNTGLQHIEGKYVTFFDGDDIWELDAFEHAWDFFENHYDEIDMVACRRKWFEGMNAYAGNDFRFKNKPARIIDIFDEPGSFHLDVTSTFIKAEIARKNAFKENLIVGEDCRYINEILLERCRYGAVPAALLNMRRRINGSSLTQSVNSSSKAAISAYTDTLRDYYEYFYEYSIKKFGRVIPYIQYLIMDAIRYRTAVPIPKGLDKEIADDYISRVTKIIEKTDLEVLLTLKRGNVSEKANLLKFKEPDVFSSKVAANGRDMLYGGVKFGRLGVKTALSIFHFESTEKNTVMAGSIKLPSFLEEPRFFIHNSSTGADYPVTDIKIDTAKSDENILGDYYKTAYEFEVEIPEPIKLEEISFYMLTDTESVKFNVNEVSL